MEPLPAVKRAVLIVDFDESISQKRRKTLSKPEGGLPDSSDHRLFVFSVPLDGNSQ